MARVRCKAGIKCLSHTEKQEGPTLVAQKCGHEFHISLRSEVRRHRDTKRQSGLPNLLLALSVSTTSAYSNLGISQGFEPPTSATNSISLPLSHISCEAVHYGGDWRNFTFDKYCTAHVDQHNRHATLAKWNVPPLEETMKIHYFEDGITDPSFAAVKSTILVDRTRFQVL